MLAGESKQNLVVVHRFERLCGPESFHGRSHKQPSGDMASNVTAWMRRMEQVFVMDKSSNYNNELENSDKASAHTETTFIPSHIDQLPEKCAISDFTSARRV